MPSHVTAEDREFARQLACRIVGRDLAEDVAQDALLNACRYGADFRGDCSFRTWLYRIVTTTALGYLRRARRRPTEALPELPDPRLPAEVELDNRVRARRALASLATLDAKYRDVIVLRAEMSEAATAARLGISIANVKIRTHRARRQLRLAVGYR